MINVTQDETKQDKPPEYPRLMISDYSRAIVLMSSYKIGTVLAKGDGLNPIGYYYKDWNMDKFTDYTGTITLENSND